MKKLLLISVCIITLPFLKLKCLLLIKAIKSTTDREWELLRDLRKDVTQS